MPTDFDQLLPTFIEESLENLADIDENLLTLDLNASNAEQIDSLFRAAHTIKGNSNIFQLKSISSMMHSMETLLDQFRKGIIKIEQKHIDLLLQASDLIRTTLFDMQKKKTPDETRINGFSDAVNKILHEGSTENQGVLLDKPSLKTKTLLDEKDAKKYSPEKKQWDIVLHPKGNIFEKNLKPERVFETLQAAGELKIELIIDKLPSFLDFNPAFCYLNWKLEFTTDISKDKITEILNWVFENEDIEVKLRNTANDESQEKLNSTSGKVNTDVNDPASVIPSTIRIPTHKIDGLINSVGELLILESMLKQAIHKIESKNSFFIQEIFELLEKNSKALQENVLNIRMVPVAFAINRFPRMVHELSTKLGKKVDFIIQGELTEIDKTMIEKITDPLLHIIRNSLDHGIESPEVRIENGKNKTGKLKFLAYQAGESINIEISDDGAGLNPEKIKAVALEKGLIKDTSVLSKDEIYSFIFKPGFSTSKIVTDLSGRGVGLDVVERNIKELGGNIKIDSIEGSGTTFTIVLPLTLAIMNCQVIKTNNQNYIIPLQSIIELEQVDIDKVTFKNGIYSYHFGESSIPMIQLDVLLQNKQSDVNMTKQFIIVVQGNGKIFALLCDDLLEQQPVVIKTLEDNFTKVPGIVGATIMGDGSIGLILEVQEIIDMATKVVTTKKPSTEHFFSQQFSTVALNGKNAKENNNNALANTNSNELLCFLLDKKEYAINMEKVVEIIFWKNPTPLPFTPIYLSGIINLRGNMVPVVDLASFFGLKSSGSNRKGIIIIVQVEKDNEQKSIGLIIDAITDTQTVYGNMIDPVPKINHLILRNYIQGLVYIDHRIITLLQIQNMVSNGAS